MKDATLKVITDIAEERVRQDEKWGEQNHPNGTHYGSLGDFAALGTKAAAARRLCDRAAHFRIITYAHIAWEEIAEAFEESDPQRLREELIQCAAVFAAWAEKIDRMGK